MLQLSEPELATRAFPARGLHGEPSRSFPLAKRPGVLPLPGFLLVKALCWHYQWFPSPTEQRLEVALPRARLAKYHDLETRRLTHPPHSAYFDVVSALAWESSIEAEEAMAVACPLLVPTMTNVFLVAAHLAWPQLAGFAEIVIRPVHELNHLDASFWSHQLNEMIARLVRDDFGIMHASRAADSAEYSPRDSLMLVNLEILGFFAWRLPPCGFLDHGKRLHLLVGVGYALGA